MASHWVVMDTIVQFRFALGGLLLVGTWHLAAIDHTLTICLILFIGIWPVGLLMFWTLAKANGMTLKEYVKKRQNGDYHSGGD